MSYGSQKKSDLKDWAGAYTKSRKDPNETRSCLIEKKDLVSLTKYIQKHKEIDGIRIYLIRKEDIHRIGLLADGKPQFSFAIVPTTGYKHEDATHVKDFFDNESIKCIIPGGENSGLCPVNCGNPVDGNP